MADAATEALLAQIIRLTSQLAVAHELLGTVMAEIALTRDDPRAYLQEMIASENGAVYAASVQLDDSSETMTTIQAHKAAYRAQVFQDADGALGRMLQSRQS